MLNGQTTAANDGFAAEYPGINRYSSKQVLLVHIRPRFVGIGSGKSTPMASMAQYCFLSRAVAALRIICALPRRPNRPSQSIAEIMRRAVSSAGSNCSTISARPIRAVCTDRLIAAINETVADRQAELKAEAVDAA